MAMLKSIPMDFALASAAERAILAPARVSCSWCFVMDAMFVCCESRTRYSWDWVLKGREPDND